MTSLRMRAILAPRGPAAAIVLTDAQVEELGGGGRAPVTVRIGERIIRARLGRMGGENLVGLSRQARADLDVEIDDEVDLEIGLDEAPREVEIPADLAEAFAAVPGVAERFAGLSYTQRREHVRGVTEAKRDQTRARRIEVIVQAMAAPRAT